MNHAAASHRTDNGLPLQVGLDAQLAELFEAIWTCERQWTIDDRIDAASDMGAPSDGPRN